MHPGITCFGMLVFQYGGLLSSGVVQSPKSRRKGFGSEHVLIYSCQTSVQARPRAGSYDPLRLCRWGI